MAKDGVESDAATCTGPTLRRSRRLELGRKLWVKIHLAIGLSFGALFIVVGLSGSILAFRQPIDEWLNAAIMRVEVTAQTTYRPLDQILAAAKVAAPPDSVPERLVLPRHSGLAASITFMATTDELETDYHEIFVDPYTAKVTGQRLLLHGDRLLSQPFIRIVMDFHWTLLLGPNKAYIVGISAIFLFVSVLAGLYLWWPRNGRWRRAATIEWGATPERIVYDLHKTVGLYLSAALMVVLLTGCAMIFKPQTRSVVASFSPLHPDPHNMQSTPDPHRAPVGIDAVVAIADTIFPDGTLHSIRLPSGPTSVYVVGKQEDREPNRSITNRNVTIEQYSGRVLHVQDREDFTSGETILEWLYPLHSGEAFGIVGCALVMVTGLAPLTLYVTGLLHWMQKRRARRHTPS